MIQVLLIATVNAGPFVCDGVCYGIGYGDSGGDGNTGDDAADGDCDDYDIW